jgi:hypothetical protein
MNISLSDLPSIMAVQHCVLKDLKKETGLRQRDWEVLCACQRLSLANYPFTTAKVDAYLQGAYFLPSLYASMGLLLEKGCLRTVVQGKPFRPESYELTYRGSVIVRETMGKIAGLFERLDEELAGKHTARVW